MRSASSRCSHAHTPILPYAHTPILWGLALLMLGTVPAGAAKLTARQVLEKAAAHYEAIEDYTADARVTVESPSIHMPEMLAKIYYKKPDKLHLESKDGFAMLPRQGLVLGNPFRDLINGLELSLARSERVLAKDCYVIKGSFRREGRIVESSVWIDKKDWLVRQIHSNPEWGPSVKVKLWYTRVARRYWLPSTTAAQVSIPPFPGAEPEKKAEPDQPTIITIKFANYRVNIGLSDTIFEKEERGN
ncbi:MAG TPA: hypothetical protein VMX94_01220 [Armatimonadota bacterium]|nr:hypothetical protein [Armatimonadota bacterium]